MKKFVVLLMVALIMVFVPHTAQASQSTWKETHCKKVNLKFANKYHDPIICMGVGWRSQADGTGIRLEDGWYRVKTNCSALETRPKTMQTNFNVSTEITQGQYFGPRNHCREDFDLETKVHGNNNVAHVEIAVKLNVNNGPNVFASTDFYICKEDLC